MNNESVDNHKTNENIFKFLNRFYFQVLPFLIVTCVHFLVTPMFANEKLFADSNLIWLALLTPGIMLTSLIRVLRLSSNNFGIPEFLLFRILASLSYGVMGALLFSKKKFLITISIILIFITIFFSIAMQISLAFTSTG